jgi:tRNA-2-methylthio-N6-dimethylallyladenosine synthase
MEYVKYNFGYMYSYSERPGTLAGRKMEDDVTETKTEDCGNCRFTTKHCLVSLRVHWTNGRSFGRKVSKKSTENFQEEIQKYRGFQKKIIKLGIVNVRITSAHGTLKGEAS